MKTIAFSSIKGGSGKSSASIMVANYLAHAKKRVLCIDMDIQNSLTFYYADGMDNMNDASIAEALHKGNLQDNIIESNREGIDLVPSSFSLVNLRTISFMTLKRLLKQIEQEYDYCIIDTAPTWDNITLNALYAADVIITPVQLTQWDWKGAIFYHDQLYQDLSPEHISKWKLLINQWKDPNTENPLNLTNEILALFAEDFDNILPVKVPSMSLVKKYIDTGEIISYAKDKYRLMAAIRDMVTILTEERMDVEAF